MLKMNASRGVWLSFLMNSVLPEPDAPAITITWRARRPLLLTLSSSLVASPEAILHVGGVLSLCVSFRALHQAFSPRSFGACFELLRSGTKAPVPVQLDEILVPLGLGRAPH